MTNAKESIFLEVTKEGALYRQAPIDAGISQPRAYSVDRPKTLAGLKAFLDGREERLQEEAKW